MNVIRSGTASDATDVTVQLLNRGAAPRSVFDGIFIGAGELLMRAPGIISLHAMTFTNAVHYAWHRTQSDETRRLLLLQNAAFMPLYRGNRQDTGVHIETLAPLTPEAKGEEAVAERRSGHGRARLCRVGEALGHHPGSHPPRRGGAGRGHAPA